MELIPSIQPVLKAGNLHDSSGVFRNQVGRATRQFRDNVGSSRAYFSIFGLSVQQSGHDPTVIRDLENNLCGRIGKCHRTEIFRLL
jgi:hypothetical protein